VTVGALILAAGRSTRMLCANKLLADLGGKPVVAHVADAVAEAGMPPPVVVLGHLASEVRAAFADRPATFVVAADFADGLSASLRAGLAAVPADWDAVLVCLGDMPVVTATTIRALVAAHRPGAIAVPVHDGQRGNPVLWDRAWFGALAGTTGDTGGKALLSRFRVNVIEIPAESRGVLIDVDTQADLSAIR
jgi:molybdenum cofactor cytidylyltransferase